MDRYEATYQLVDGDDALKALGVERVYRSGGVDTPKEECFIVLAWGDDESAFAEVGTQSLTVWTYDVGRSYARVDVIVGEVRRLLARTVGLDGVSQFRWRVSSGDLYDDMWKRLARNALFTVV